MSTLTATLPFQQIAPYLAVGSPTPAGWRALTDHPLLILVGVTGVGKSTLLTALDAHGAHHLLLPDRRDLTDRLIISAMQAADGTPIIPVTDRGQRFSYTRRYREQYAGGMAHALTQLWVSDDAPAALLLFDGLRGANEVTFAASALPRARFVMLDAPDIVRLQRLLGRGDAFDRIHVASTSSAKSTEVHSFDDLEVPAARAIFTDDEEATIIGWLQPGAASATDLRAKLQIVIEERQSYDPAATLAALQNHAANAMLYIDTVTHAPDAVAGQVVDWLKKQ